MASYSLISYKEVEAIFSTCPLESTTSKENIVYINEARMINYPIVLTSSPPFPSRLITFSEDNVYTVHFPHNDVLIVTMQIGSCRVFRILFDSGASINILYRSALGRMEDAPEMAQTMIWPRPNRICMSLTGMRHARLTQSCSWSALIRTTSSGVLCDRRNVPS